MPTPERHLTKRSTLRFVDRSLIGFVIFRITVDLPEIVELGVGQSIFDAQHRGHHGMVLIVVLVHPIAADEMEATIGGGAPSLTIDCVSMATGDRVTFVPKILGKLQFHLQRGIVRHRVEMLVKFRH